MMKILQTLISEQGRIKDDASAHQQDDRDFRVEVTDAFREVKAGVAEVKTGQEELHTQVKTLTATVAKIGPMVDELREDKIRAQERASVIRELAEKKKLRAADNDRDDERRSRWLGPILGAGATVIFTLAGGWAYDHFHDHHDAKATTTITSTVDRPR